MSTDELHALFDKVANTVDSIGTRVDALGTRMDSLETGMNSLAASLETFAAKMDAQREADRKEFEERETLEAMERRVKREVERRRARKNVQILKMASGKSWLSRTEVAKAFFFESLGVNKVLKGIKFDHVSHMELTDVSKGLRGAFDLILVNDHDAFLGTVRFKARWRNLEHLVGTQEWLFRELFPQYKNLILHLGLAAFHFSEGLVEECLAQDVTVLKCVGKTIETQYPPEKT